MPAPQPGFYRRSLGVELQLLMHPTNFDWPEFCGEEFLNKWQIPGKPLLPGNPTLRNSSAHEKLACGLRSVLSESSDHLRVCRLSGMTGKLLERQSLPK